MSGFKKKVENFTRIKEIITIFVEEGFSLFLDNHHLRKFISIRHKICNPKKTNMCAPIRLTRALERLGPTFIKFGQVLSIRPDFVPKEYIKQLEKLQENVNSVPYEDIKEIIEESTGQKIDEIFKKFNREPIASASIAQVHKAILRSGDIVAVKIKRPKIKQIMESDIEIMRMIARVLQKHTHIKKYDPVEIIEEFAEWTRRELNFFVEAQNINRFYENFKGSKTTKIPKVYESLTNENMIVMEFINGIPLSKLSKKRKSDIDLRICIENGFNSLLEQVFVHGFFHGDPHPSNIFVLKGNKIAFVDFGIVGIFNDSLKDKCVDLVIGISEGDSEKIIDALTQTGKIDSDINLDKLKNRIGEIIYPLNKASLKDINITKSLEQILDSCLEFNMKMPLEFILFAKAILTIEGVGLRYYPDFNFGEESKSFIKKLIEQKYSPKRIIKKSLFTLIGLKNTIERIPGQAQRVLSKLEEGKIRIEMKDTDIEKLSVELDKSSNRVTYGMIIAALLISGSLVISVGPRWREIPIITLFCFSVALVFGLILFVSILNERRGL